MLRPDVHYDTDGEGTDHYLPDHTGQNIVKYPACSSVPGGAPLAELGFRTFYHSNDPGQGMASGAKLGVIGDISTPQRGDYSQGGPAPDGSQYYMMEDTDGFVYVEINAVYVGDYTGVVMSGWAHIESATWEDTDHVKMWATDTVTGAETVLIEGTNIDVAAGIQTGNITENSWTEYRAAIPTAMEQPAGGATNLVMHFGVAADTTSKETWWDHFRILGFGEDRSRLYCSTGPGFGPTRGCTAGTYRGAGMQQCQPCALGETSEDGAGSCTPCLRGTYGSVPGQCQACFANANAEVTSAPGSTSVADCVDAPRVIGYTSFEEVPTVGGSTVPSYTDPLSGNGDTDHWLPSVDGDNPINWVPCVGLATQGKELGFRTHYFNEDTTKFLGSANVGVIGDTTTDMNGDSNQGKTAPDGSQYFMIENTNSGFVRVEIDPVYVADFTGLVMSGWVQIESSLWEESDNVKIWAGDPATAYETILLDAHDIDTAVNVAEDAWREYTTALGNGYGTVTMNFGLISENSYEETWWDHFRVTGYGPERSSMYCSGCVAGQYRSAGSATCDTCPPGTSSDAGSSACSPCPTGTFNGRTGAPACQPCSTDPMSSTTSPIGSTDQAQCFTQRRIIGYTSFEEPVPAFDYGCSNSYNPPRCQVPLYRDTLGSATSHYLINNVHESPVDYSACSMWNATLGLRTDGGMQELGFRAHYTPTGSADWEQGAKVGVIGDINTVQRGDNLQGGSAPHGTQYYMLEDTNSWVHVEIDEVAVTGFRRVQMRAWVMLESSSYEANDRIAIWTTDTPTGTERMLLDAGNIDAGDGTGVGSITKDQWREYRADLVGWTSASMNFGFQVDDTFEESWFDYFRIMVDGPDRTGMLCTARCTPGTFGAAGSDQRVACPAGTADVDQKGWTPCEACELNTYSSAGSTACIDCPTGTYSPRGSAWSAPRVRRWPRWEEPATARHASRAATTMTPCVNCPAGAYSAVAGALSCTLCPTGKSTLPGALQNSSVACLDAGCTDAAAVNYDSQAGELNHHFFLRVPVLYVLIVAVPLRCSAGVLVASICRYNCDALFSANMCPAWVDTSPTAGPPPPPPPPTPAGCPPPPPPSPPVCPPCRATGAYCGTGTQWNGQLCIATQGDAPSLPAPAVTPPPPAITSAACQTAGEGGTGVGIVIGMLLMYAFQKAAGGGGGGGKATGGSDALDMTGNPTSMYAQGDTAL